MGSKGGGLRRYRHELSLNLYFQVTMRDGEGSCRSVHPKELQKIVTIHTTAPMSVPESWDRPFSKGKLAVSGAGFSRSTPS